MVIKILIRSKINMLTFNSIDFDHDNHCLFKKENFNALYRNQCQMFVRKTDIENHLCFLRPSITSYLDSIEQFISCGSFIFGILDTDNKSIIQTQCIFITLLILSTRFIIDSDYIIKKLGKLIK